MVLDLTLLVVMGNKELRKKRKTIESELSI